MNAGALAAVAALVTSTVVLLGLSGFARIPTEGYAGLGLLLTGFAATAWGRETELPQHHDADAPAATSPSTEPAAPAPEVGTTAPESPAP